MELTLICIENLEISQKEPSIGIYGLITSRNIVRALMCLELILNGVNINFVTFSDFFDSRQLKKV
ncbi:hypothetical protein Lal_00024219 [Lupinus albus]|nr:hypothetical protein Lal_00024219 [Lupinus albus]